MRPLRDRVARRAAVIAAVAASASAPAMAGPFAAEPPDDSGKGGVWVGGGGALLTTGAVSGTINGVDSRSDLSTTGAVEAVIEYQATHMVAIGVMPRYVFGFHGTEAGDDTTDTFSMMDLRARVSIGDDIGARTRTYGFGGVGWSIVSLPSTFAGATGSGVTFTLGAGASYRVGERVRVFGEAGYELGLQSLHSAGATEDFHVSFLELVGGVQVVIGG